MIDILNKAKVVDILVVGESGETSPHLQKALSTSTLGNDLGLRFWRGDIHKVPSYMGPADRIIFTSFSDINDKKAALFKAASLLRPSGKVLLLSCLESENQMSELVSDLPLTLNYVDEENISPAGAMLLQIPDLYAFKGSPLSLEGEVILGKGIGSASLGVPTANLNPESFKQKLQHQPKGVYYGWVSLLDGIYGAVFNLGTCPTMKGETEVTFEAHILHSFDHQFYGESIKAVLIGFLRPEIKFAGVHELLKQIQIDIGIAKNQLKLSDVIAIKQKLLEP